MSDQEEMVRTPLSEVLSSEADQVIVDEQVEPEQTQEPEATETVEKDAAPTAEETTQNEVSEVDKLRTEINAYKTKAYDEKGKRQALQSQLEGINKAQVKKPDAFVNPDDAITYGNNELRTEFNNRFWNMSESQARGRYDDFDAMKDMFLNEMVIDNPLLGQQAVQADDPFDFIYQQAKTHNELKDVGSLSDYRTKIENEMRAKFEAEYAGKAADATEQAISNALPGTLSTATATGGNQTPTWAGPTSLNSILGKNK
ncbi:MAG: hypothetical protein V3T88_07870 [Nitrosomonadaceae bacterium]